MLGHYLLSAARQLRRHRSHTMIAASGLALSLAGVFLILLYVLNEVSYDRYHGNARRIYRVLTDMTLSGNHIRGPMTSGLLAPALTASIPEISRATRISPQWIRVVRYANQEFRVNGHYAEPGLFELFSFLFVSGSVASFGKPRTALLTRSTAEKMFHREDPVGKVIAIPEYGTIEVVGVLQDVPAQSHFTFDVLVSFDTLSPRLLGWGAFQFWTYLLIPEGHDTGEIEHKLLALEKTKRPHIDVEKEIKLRYALQPLESIYFAKEDAPNKGDIRYVYLFSLIAALILLMACANYASLTIAKTGIRLKEIGMRKVFGADRTHLVFQFLSESLLLTLIALPLWWLVIGMALPLLRTVTDKVHPITDDMTLLAAFLSSIFVFIVTGGLYPAMLISGSKTAGILRGQIKKSFTLQRLQKGILLFQFAVSIALVTVTLMIQRQMHYLQHTDLGFDKSDVVIVRVPPGQSWEVMKSALTASHQIAQVSASAGIPGALPGMVVPVQAEGVASEDAPPVRIVSVDADFIPTLGIRLADGRNFSADMETDAASACILNEAAIRQLGLIETVGKSLTVGHEKLDIVGVVRDFHFESLHNEIAPLMLRMAPDQWHILAIRIKSGDFYSVKPFIQRTWQQLAPGYFFSYSILEDDLNTLYGKESDFKYIFLAFSTAAIVIAGLGVLGLSAFIVRQRTKEIGMRRVLGASIADIIALIAGDFLRLAGWATAIAAPVAYYFMQTWLQEFAYRVRIAPFSFVLAGFITVMLILITVSSQVIKAARANPAETLRNQ